MNDKTFTLTADHVRLIRNMQVGWQDAETGAPEIDPKRPYGNSDVPGDIHEILTGELVDNDTVVLNREQRTRYLALHRETEEALQVVLAAGTFSPGDYRAPAYTARYEAEGGVWGNNGVQFPRLLAEIIGVGLSEEQWDALLQTMDLESDQLNVLFDRAQAEWEEEKAHTVVPRRPV